MNSPLILCRLKLITNLVAFRYNVFHKNSRHAANLKISPIIISNLVIITNNTISWALFAVSNGFHLHFNPRGYDLFLLGLIGRGERAREVHFKN